LYRTDFRHNFALFPDLYLFLKRKEKEELKTINISLNLEGRKGRPGHNFQNFHFMDNGDYVASQLLSYGKISIGALEITLNPRYLCDMHDLSTCT